MSISASIANKIQSWQLSRSPRAKSVELTQRNTYIFPTRYGFLLLATVLLMGVGATNYQNNLVFVATFITITLGLLSILLTFSNLVGLRVTAHSSAPVYQGQSATISFTVLSEKDHYAISLGILGENLHTIDVIGRSENRVDLNFFCNQRGVYQVPRVRCQTLYPFGFLQAWSWLFFDSEVVVYPKPICPESLQTEEVSSGDEHDEIFRDGNEDFYGLKAYQKGDSMSRIHWKSFARGKGLQTKQFVDYQSDPDIFDFDAYVNVDTETRLSFLCFQCLAAHRESAHYGLKLKQTTISADYGDEHLHRCLTALAKFQS